MHSAKQVYGKKYCVITAKRQPEKINGIFEGHEGKAEFESNIDEWKHKWPDGRVTWKLERHSDDFDRTYNLMRIFALAFLTWQKEIKNIKFRRVRRVSADADIPINFLKSTEDKLFKERPGVLAYAYFPTPNSPIGGDMVFNDDYIWSWDGAGVSAHDVDPKHYPDPATPVKIKTWNLQHTGVHEIGHALGLRHNNECRDCVMFPYYNAKVHLNENDIERIQTFYGRRSLPMWLYNALKFRILRGWSGR